MVETLLIALLCTGVIAYLIWIFAIAKQYAPLTLEEAKILWKIHKQAANCPSNSWREIRKGGKMVGFRCECGYRHVQKKPLNASKPSQNSKSYTSIHHELHRA
jgi:hypothetical protein